MKQILPIKIDTRRVECKEFTKDTIKVNGKVSYIRRMFRDSRGTKLEIKGLYCLVCGQVSFKEETVHIPVGESLIYSCTHCNRPLI